MGDLMGCADATILVMVLKSDVKVVRMVRVTFGVGCVPEQLRVPRQFGLVPFVDEHTWAVRSVDDGNSDSFGHTSWFRDMEPAFG